MRNYIILNNKKSDTISGLIIQELPAISKPAQRTQVETIDGRDGDIITPLGYAAYNKKIKIGLYGTFDINEIIAYFATQGQVIFSNEPNKYYNYQIVDQIDYERLVRYKVATVTMHVQPFKYSATESPIIVDSSDTVSGEGSNIALANTAEAPFNVLRHKGNAIQDGTPTPDNPIDIKVLTGDSTVKITGKNLVDISTVGWGYVNSSGVITGRTSQQNWLSEPIKVSPNTTYTFSLKNPSGSDVFTRLSIAYYDSSEQFILRDAQTAGSSTSRSFTTPSHCEWVRVTSAKSPDWTEDTRVGYKPQFELGNQATDYEEFKGQSYVIPFGDTYLAKIGDYADEPVNVDGTWYIRRAIGKVVLDGTENWGGSLYGGYYRAYAYVDDALQVAASADFVGLSDYFHKDAGLFSTSTISEGMFCLYKNTAQLFFSAPISVQTNSDWKIWLGTHNTTVYYVLATPTDEEITDQDLIDALDELYDQAHAYKGHTHITATAADGNAPAVLSVEVGEDNESTVTNAGNTTSRPILTIYGQGDIGVYINDVEVLQVALNDEGYITLDSVEMEAYKDSTANLKNRLVTGDYSKLALNAGANKIRFTGIVTKYEISKYSRWL